MRMQTSVTLPQEIRDFLSARDVSLSRLVANLLADYRLKVQFEESHPGYKLVTLPVPAGYVQMLKGDFDVKKFEALMGSFLGKAPEPPKACTLDGTTFLFAKEPPAPKASQEDEDLPDNLEDIKF